MLSSTARPQEGIKKETHIRNLKSEEETELSSWFTPINGQEDNLAGLGGNWDYLKWNAMVVACYHKQLQLGPNLEKLVRVHPPIELYREFEDGEGGKVKKVSIMGKEEFLVEYGRKDLKSPPKQRAKETQNEDEERKKKAEEAEKRKRKVEGEKGERGLTRCDLKDDSDEDIPEWRRRRPAPVGTKRVPHLLEHLYSKHQFLPLDAKGQWVPPRQQPERNLLSLLDSKDPLYSVLKSAAIELLKEQKSKPKKKRTKTVAGESDEEFNPDSEENESDNGGVRETGLNCTVSRRSQNIRKPPQSLSHSILQSTGRVAKGSQNERKYYGENILRRTGARFNNTGLRIVGSKRNSPPITDATSIKRSIAPWEKYHSSGSYKPDFARKKWPTLKKDLQLKRWHLIPVACNVNGELRWWLLVIDMQVQKRSDQTGDKAEIVGRGLWVFNPCAPITSDSTSDGVDPKTKFLENVGNYLVHLANAELSNLDHNGTPVEFPRSSDIDDLEKLEKGTLAAHQYDRPGRFKHFVTAIFHGTRYNYNNRNPQTGIEVIHAMGRALWMIERDDARIEAMAKIMSSDMLSCGKPSDVEKAKKDVYYCRKYDLELGSGGEKTLQNRVRTETMTEVRRYIDMTHFKGWPFRRETPKSIPDEGYQMLEALYNGHPEAWKQISNSFDHGAHGVVVGMDYNLCSKTESCDQPLPHIIHFPMTLGTMAILHGYVIVCLELQNRLNRMWDNVEALEALAALPKDDQDNKRRGCLYKRYDHLMMDFEGKGSIPVDGGPDNPSIILLDEYPQSMVSLIIDDKGQSIIHVGNRPNSIWEINGIQVTQSEVIDRFSHVTHLYGNGMHWLFLRRFAKCESADIKIESNIPSDIKSWVRRRRSQKPVGTTNPDAQHGALEVPSLIYPATRYLNTDFKKSFYDLGNHTPHFHHHHRPMDVESGKVTDEEKILWDSYGYLGNIFLCQNPICRQHSKTFGIGGSQAAANLSSIPCFDHTCVESMPETKIYGSVTCTDLLKNRCLPNDETKLRGHIPGIPGHLFVETGVLLLQPEMLISESEKVISSQGLGPRKLIESGDRKKDNLNILPQPPLSWNRIAFSPISRFPSVKAAKKALRKVYNYNPSLLSEGETTGLVYDLTRHEELNYYRLLAWNALTFDKQREVWREHARRFGQDSIFDTYHLPKRTEASVRLGLQVQQNKNASGAPGSPEMTTNSVGNDNNIIGTGDPWAWDFFHGRLPQGELPASQGPGDGSKPHRKFGSSYASNLINDTTRTKTMPIGFHSAGKMSDGSTALQGTFVERLLGQIIRRQPMLPIPKSTLREVSIASSNEETNIAIPLSRELSPCPKFIQKDGSPIEEENPLQNGIHETEISSKDTTVQEEDPLDEIESSPKSSPSIDDRSALEHSSLAPSEIDMESSTPLIIDVDGRNVNIRPYDKLLPVTFYTPYEKGVIQETCIQITRPGLPNPILLRAKQTYIPNGLQRGKEHGNMSIENDEMEESEESEESKGKEEAEEKLVEEVKVHTNEEELIRERMDSEVDLGSSLSSKKSRSPQSHVATQMPEAEDCEDGNDTSEIGEVVEEPSPETNKRKRKAKENKVIEDGDYGEPSTKKKRGPKPGARRKKINPDNQPYMNMNEDNADTALDEAGEALDTVVKDKSKESIQKIQPSRKMKGIPRMLREME
ncbi:hypothetical protein ABW20_dc0104002 [Dactylellina cionopaga]|nr:hypothetical protein ABW20_dc0104002 [Dactylellina cionopaga]